MPYLLLSVLIIIGDRCLKGWVEANIAVGERRPLLPGLLRLTHIENTGAAFSILEGGRILFLSLTVVICTAILIFLLAGKIRGGLGRLGAAMLLGGAVGNAIDRAASGRVVDMFEFEFINFAVFNIADIFITFGGALFCLYVVLIEYKERHKKAPAASPPSGGGEDADGGE